MTRIDQLLQSASDALAAGEHCAMRYYIGEIERALEVEKERWRRMRTKTTPAVSETAPRKSD